MSPPIGAVTLLANWMIWTRPVWPLLVGIALAVAIVWGVPRLWAERHRLGMGPVLVSLNAAALLLLVALAFVAFGLGMTLDAKIVGLTVLLVTAPAAVYTVLYFVQPKIAAIALTTTREGIAQPLFWVMIFFGVFALLAFPYIPYYTFGEDVKMLKDSGLTLLMVLSIILALWTASVAVADEIEGKTALTVLSKPVSRRHFILGKFLGICGVVATLFLILGTVFLVTISYKEVYDAAETGNTAMDWTQCWASMAQVVPGLILSFLEAAVLTSISVAISTRLPMLPNLVICASIYAIGHLVPMLVNSNVGDNEIVRFVGQFFASVFPMLDHFNIQAVVSTGRTVPLIYLAWAMFYSLIYCSFAILGALILFEDRDLA